MNDAEFNRELKRFSNDLELHFDPRKRLWGVYQMRSRHFVMAGNAETRPWLLFDITDDRGSFRLPHRGDVARAFKSVIDRDKMQRWGSDKYVDKIESQEAERQAKVDAKLHDDIHQASKDVAAAARGKVTTTLWRS